MKQQLLQASLDRLRAAALKHKKAVDLLVVVDNHQPILAHANEWRMALLDVSLARNELDTVIREELIDDINRLFSR